MEKRFEYLALLAVVFILVAGCYLVLRPFLTATLLAAVLCVSTWPVYVWMLRKMHGRENLAAFSMTLSLALLLSFWLRTLVIFIPARVQASISIFFARCGFKPDPVRWRPQPRDHNAGAEAQNCKHYKYFSNVNPFVNSTCVLF